VQFEERKEKELGLALSTQWLTVDTANAALSQKQTELNELKRRNELSREEEKTLEQENL